MSVGGTHRIRVVLPQDDFDFAIKRTVLKSEYIVDQEFLQRGTTWRYVV